MTAVAILREETELGRDLQYRAIATNSGKVESVGRTAGAALDALAAQLSDEEGGTLVVVQQMRPDHFFTEKQASRLKELMQQVQTAALAEPDRAELESLIDDELIASSQRAASLADALGR